ncbi:class I SAM-dependent methyltransferase [Yaniella flava]|uniref:Class I SAM-dependent methyltransferase n=1 Tax=Yaniella flava TaxID=287930 RepID=A0ABN2V3J6_9MICC
MSLSDSFSFSARRYDFLTRLNPGYRRELRAAARQLAEALDEQPPERPLIWDLGCGTGLSTRALLKTMPQARVVGVDASAGMLDHARAKTWPEGTQFLQERVEQLEDNPAPELAEAPDGIFAAYLLRNVPSQHRTEVLASLQRQLKPDAPLVLHDYSISESRLAQVKWTTVCFAIVIPLSALVGAKTGLFTYLWRSVMDNDSTQTVLARLQQAGLHNVKSSTARGWHRRILHTYTAIKAGIRP